MILRLAVLLPLLNTETVLEWGLCQDDNHGAKFRGKIGDAILVSLVVIITRSNLYEAFQRWIKEADPKKNPEGALFCHKTMAAVLEGTQLTDVGLVTVDPFEYGANQMQMASNHGAPLPGISATVRALP